MSDDKLKQLYDHEESGCPFDLMLDETRVLSPGMSLRDWFAGQALAQDPGGEGREEKIAASCYRFADAMLREREK